MMEKVPELLEQSDASWDSSRVKPSVTGDSVSEGGFGLGEDGEAGGLWFSSLCRRGLGFELEHGADFSSDSGRVFDCLS